MKITVNVVLPGHDENGDPLPLGYVRTHLPHYDHWLGGLVDAIYIDPDTVPKLPPTPSVPSVVRDRWPKSDGNGRADDMSSQPPSSPTASAPPAHTSGVRPKHPVHPPYRCIFPDNT